MKTTHVFRCLGRDWTLYRRGTGNREPSPKTPWSFRLRVDGKRVLVSTRTAHLSTAVEAAKKRIEGWMGGNLEALDVGRAKTGKGKIPTFAEVAKVYGEAGVVRPSTADANLWSLKRIVSVALEIPPDQVAGLRIGILGESVAEKWLARKQGLERPNYGEVLPANTSANSTLRQAQAVFAARHRHVWKDWQLPAGVAAFKGARLLKEGSHRFTPADESVYAKMDKAAELLRKGVGVPERETVRGRNAADTGSTGLTWDGYELWVVNRSIRLMGLRASEVAAMKTGWLVESGGKLFLDVVSRPGEFVPKGHEGRVQVPDVLRKEFLARRKEAGDKSVHLIRAGSDTERRDLVLRAHSKWLRQFFPAGQHKKTNHELRKHAGSLVARKFNSWEAAARFLREDLETAKKHYLELLHPVGLEVGDLTTTP
ncbi:MAG: hypothetical protein ACKV19_07115 [Verrucomicrobiales bacterium]